MKAFSRKMVYFNRMYCSGNGIHSNVNTSEIRKILNTTFNKNNQSSVNEGVTCFTFTCPCPSMKNPVHVNKITGFFSCPACDRSGPWQIFANYIKKISKQPNTIPMPDELTMTPNLFAEQWIEILNNSRPFSELDEEESQKTLELFKLPVFSDAPKLLSEVRISNDGDKLYFPLSDVIGKVRGVRWLCAEDNSSGVLPTSNCSGILFLRTHKRNNIVRESTPIVVSGIKNAVAVVSKKIPGGAICLPYDFSSLPQITLPALEKWNKLILWGSTDTDTSQARAIARKLGEKRCLLVRPTEDKPSPLEAVHQGLDLKTVAYSAKPIWHKAITTFSSLKEDVLSELYNIDKVQGIKWKRYPTLNRLLRGHRRGELTILTGPTGCGKTTFCSEYSLDLAMQGVNTLWGSFEIRNARLARTMLQQFIGFPLEENLDKFEAVAEAFQELPIYFLTFHGQQTIKDVMEAVEHATYIHDIAHVIIDNVQFMLGVGDEPTKHLERFWRQDAVIAAFRTFATRTNCHVTLVMHPRKEKDVDDLSTNSIFGSAKASQEADNVLIIQDKRLTAVRGKKYLQIAKNRYTGELGVMPLNFDKTKLSYASKSDKGAKKGEDEEDGPNE